MAGHSKWHNIQARKSVQDAKKSKFFTKVTKELMLAARAGGADTALNVRLKSAIVILRELGTEVSPVQPAFNPARFKAKAAGVAAFGASVTRSRKRGDPAAAAVTVPVSGGWKKPSVSVKAWRLVMV